MVLQLPTIGRLKIHFLNKNKYNMLSIFCLHPGGEISYSFQEEHLCVSFNDRNLFCLIFIYSHTYTYMQNVNCFGYFLQIRYLNVKISYAFSLLLYACIDF